MTFWTFLILAAAVAAMNVNAARSGQMLVGASVLTRSRNPTLFAANLIGRWVVVAMAVAGVAAAQLSA